jgi:hypothetical protein
MKMVRMLAAMALIHAMSCNATLETGFLGRQTITVAGLREDRVTMECCPADTMFIALTARVLSEGLSLGMDVQVGGWMLDMSQLKHDSFDFRFWVLFFLANTSLLHIIFAFPANIEWQY